MRWRNQQKQRNQRVIDPLDFSWTLFVEWLLRDMYMWLVLSAIACNRTRVSIVIVGLLFSDTVCPVPDVGRNCWVRNDWDTVNIPYPCVCNYTPPSVVSAFWPFLEHRIELVAMGFPCIVFTPPLYDDVIKWRHFLRYWPFVQGIHRTPVNSLYKGQWSRVLMFSLICACIKMNKQSWGWWFETPSRS